MTMTWTVTVMGPDGQVDTGRYSITGDVLPPPEHIAESLSDMAWRIAMDLAQEASTEPEPHEEMSG